MKKRGTARFVDLTATGQNVISLTPDTAAQAGRWETGNVPVRDSRGWFNYVRRFWQNVTFTIDQPASGGSVINWDMLGRAVQSMELVSPDLGTIYSHQHTRGPVIQHLITPISLGYSQVQTRSQIAAADNDYLCQLLTLMPLSNECLKLPDESAQAAVFFQNGTLTTLFAPANIFASTSAGSATESVQLRAVAEYFATPDKYLGAPYQWQDREIQGGGDSPILRSVGQQTGWQDMRAGCGIAGLWWLTNAPHIGLGGNAGTDSITQISIQALDQPALRNLDPYYWTLSLTKRVATRGLLGATIATGETGWPRTIASQPDGSVRPASNPNNLFLPIITPSDDAESSKFPRWSGDLQVNFNFSPTTPTTPHRFVTLEALEFGEVAVSRLAQRAGFGTAVKRRAATPGGEILDPGQLRYTAIEFD